MITAEEITIAEEDSLRDALVTLDRTGNGFLFAVNSAGKLAGVLTDGDVRRAILKGATALEKIATVMRRNCVSLPVSASTGEIREALKGDISFIPLNDEAGRPVDFASVSRLHRFPVAQPWLGGNEEEYVLECVKTGWISSQGRFVTQFEKMFADFHGVTYALAVSNGTVALRLALISLGIKQGDEVLVPNFTFAASASAVIHAGGTPRLVDVNEKSWCITPEILEKYITPQTRALMPVHLYGQPCAMEVIRDFSSKRGLIVVEDCAESLGAISSGKSVGTWGDAGCFSFFGNKTITTGEGGMILFKDRQIYEHAKCLRDHGMSSAKKYWHEEVGFNDRLTNLQAAIGVAQMERIGEIMQRKQSLSSTYDLALRSISGLQFPQTPLGGESVCWLYTLAVEKSLGISRDEMMRRLLLNGVESRPVFYPLHEMPAYKAFGHDEEFPVTSDISARGFSLPSAVTLQEEEIKKIAGVIRSMTQVRQLTEEVTLA